jgi:hypothetical protein
MNDMRPRNVVCAVMDFVSTIGTLIEFCSNRCDPYVGYHQHEICVTYFGGGVHTVAPVHDIQAYGSVEV